MYRLRYSGRYNGSISNVALSCGDRTYKFTEKYLKLFNQLETEYVKTIVLTNNKVDGFSTESGDVYLSYEELNKNYTYVDFRYATQYTLFILYKQIRDEYQIMMSILKIGFSAQELCLYNADESTYNRPVKHVVSTQLWNQKFSDWAVKYMPFYAVITGRSERKLSDE